MPAFSFPQTRTFQALRESYVSVGTLAHRRESVSSSDCRQSSAGLNRGLACSMKVDLVGRSGQRCPLVFTNSRH